MPKKILITILTIGTLILTGGIFYVVKNGYKPESVKIIDLTQFGRPKNIGVAIFRRYWNEMQTAKIVIIGEDMRLKKSAEIWDGFIEEGVRKGIVFDLILSRPSFGEIESYMKTSKRLLVRMDTTDSNIQEIVKRNWPDGLYFQQGLFIPGATDEIEKQFPCDSRTDEKMNCQIQDISIQYRLKRYNPSRYIAVLEHTYPNQFVLFVHEPEVSP